MINPPAIIFDIASGKHLPQPVFESTDYAAITEHIACYIDFCGPLITTRLPRSIIHSSAQFGALRNLRQGIMVYPERYLSGGLIHYQLNVLLHTLNDAPLSDLAVEELGCIFYRIFKPLYKGLDPAVLGSEKPIPNPPVETCLNFPYADRRTNSPFKLIIYHFAADNRSASIFGYKLRKGLKN